MKNNDIYDIIGIGIGPFNLGLAALATGIPGLKCLFMEKNDSFNWHPGMMLANAKMQVPFYADLVTLADPTSPYSYMNYLKATGKLFRFAINESYYPYRSEYNEYCQWVVKQLNNLHFGYECKSISYNRNQRIYAVSTLEKSTAKLKVITAKHIVIGIGSTPHLPACVKNMQHPNIFHSSEYLQRKNIALMHKHITLIGSGQSAAEIFMDLLPHINNLQSLNWYTRSNRFYAMDYSKFSLELSSPDYIRYFYNLPKQKKADIFRQQHDLYKGINFSLIEDIYEQLYVLSLNKANRVPVLQTSCELRSIMKNNKNSYTVEYLHCETEQVVEEETEVLILATGYKPAKPTFIDGIAGQINWDENGNYRISEDYSINDRHTIFVQNADWHTHGFNSADLGLGPYRNTTIINGILQQEGLIVEKAGIFQHF